MFASETALLHLFSKPMTERITVFGEPYVTLYRRNIDFTLKPKDAESIYICMSL